MAIPANNHFKILRSNFMKYTKFNVIELSETSNICKDALTSRVERGGDFWIIKLKHLLKKDKTKN